MVAPEQVFLDNGKLRAPQVAHVVLLHLIF